MPTTLQGKKQSSHVQPSRKALAQLVARMKQNFPGNRQVWHKANRVQSFVDNPGKTMPKSVHDAIQRLYLLNAAKTGQQSINVKQILNPQKSLKSIKKGDLLKGYVAQTIIDYIGVSPDAAKSAVERMPLDQLQQWNPNNPMHLNWVKQQIKPSQSPGASNATVGENPEKIARSLVQAVEKITEKSLDDLVTGANKDERIAAIKSGAAKDDAETLTLFAMENAYDAVFNSVKKDAKKAAKELQGRLRSNVKDTKKKNDKILKKPVLKQLYDLRDLFLPSEYADILKGIKQTIGTHSKGASLSPGQMTQALVQGTIEKEKEKIKKKEEEANQKAEEQKKIRALEDERDDYESDLGRAQEQLQQTQDNLMQANSNLGRAQEQLQQTQDNLVKANSRVAAQDNVRAMPQSEQGAAFARAALQSGMNFQEVEKSKKLATLYDALSPESKGFIDRWDEKMQDPNVFWSNQLQYEKDRAKGELGKDLDLMEKFFTDTEEIKPEDTQVEGDNRRFSKDLEKVLKQFTAEDRITIMRTMMHELPYQQRRRYQEYGKKEAMVSTDAINNYVKESDWSDYTAKTDGTLVPSLGGLQSFAKLAGNRLNNLISLNKLKKDFETYNRGKSEAERVTPSMVMAVKEAEKIPASDHLDQYDTTRQRMRDKVADAIKEIPGLSDIVNKVTAPTSQSGTAKSAYALIGLPNLENLVHGVWDKCVEKKKLDDAYKQATPGLAKRLLEIVPTMVANTNTWLKPLGNYATQRSTANRAMTGIMNTLVLNVGPSKYKDVFTITPDGEVQTGGQTIPDATWEKGPGHAVAALEPDGQEKWKKVFSASTAMNTVAWEKHIKDNGPIKSGKTIEEEYDKEAKQKESDEIARILNAQSGEQALQEVRKLVAQPNNQSLWNTVLPKVDDLNRFMSDHLSEYLSKTYEYKSIPDKKDEVIQRYKAFFQGQPTTESAEDLAMFDVLWSEWKQKDNDKKGADWLEKTAEALQGVTESTQKDLQGELATLKGFQTKKFVGEKDVEKLEDPKAFVLSLLKEDKDSETIMGAWGAEYRRRVEALVRSGNEKVKKQEQDRKVARDMMSKIDADATIALNSRWTEVKHYFALSDDAAWMLPTKWIDTLIEEAQGLKPLTMSHRAEVLQTKVGNVKWGEWKPTEKKWESCLVLVVQKLLEELTENDNSINSHLNSKMNSYKSNICLPKVDTDVAEGIINVVKKDSGNYIVKDGRIESLASEQNPNKINEILSDINNSIKESEKIWTHIEKTYQYKDLQKKEVANFLDNNGIERSDPKQIQDTLEKVCDNHLESKVLSSQIGYFNGNSNIPTSSLGNYLKQNIDVQEQENKTLKDKISVLQDKYKLAWAAYESQGDEKEKDKREILMVPYVPANSDKETFVQTVKNSVIVQEKELVEARKGYEDAWKEVARSYKAWKKYDDKRANEGVPGVSEGIFYQDPKQYNAQLEAEIQKKQDAEIEANRDAEIAKLQNSLAELKNYNSTAGTEVQNLIAAADVTAKTTAFKDLVTQVDPSLAGEDFPKQAKKLSQQIGFLMKCYKENMPATKQKLGAGLSVLDHLTNVNVQTLADVKRIQDDDLNRAISAWDASIGKKKISENFGKMKENPKARSLENFLTDIELNGDISKIPVRSISNHITELYETMWSGNEANVWDLLQSPTLKLDNDTRAKYTNLAKPEDLRDSVKNSQTGLSDKVHMIKNVLLSLLEV